MAMSMIIAKLSEMLIIMVNLMTCMKSISAFNSGNFC